MQTIEMQTILIVAATLLAVLLIVLAVPGALFLIGMYKASKAGRCTTPDKLRWMADQIEGAEVEVKISGDQVVHSMREYEEARPL